MIGELAGIACAVLWAVVSLMMRSVADGVGAAVVNGVRCGIAACTLLLVLAFSGRLGELTTLPAGTIVAILGSGIAGQAIGDALFVGAAKLIGASRALPIAGSSPLLTVVLAIVLLGEEMPPLALTGAVIVIVGVYFLAVPVNPFRQRPRAGDALDRRGVLLALAAAICWTVSTLILRAGLGEVDLVAANSLRLVVATFSLAAIELVHAGPHRPKGLNARMMRVMLPAGALSAFSSLMYLTSVYYAGAAKASIINATSPLFGLPLALIFLHEKLTPRIVAGTLLCILGIWLVLWR
ncbi:MAG: DMT family transporter [Chloroflexota bacterium]